MSAQNLRILLNTADLDWHLETVLRAALEAVEDQEAELRELKRRVEDLERGRVR